AGRDGHPGGIRCAADRPGRPDRGVVRRAPPAGPVGRGPLVRDRRALVETGDRRRPVHPAAAGGQQAVGAGGRAPGL
ncbi:MAG: hypothetical protein AVDCRST_MAG51-1911, partial [uncultured Ramlibacter sp.]